ncbi:hypothetical protein [Stackebrandtia soli]|uniref:hypothetical protein n=1 Tax=Stackebrandtia soli TaxID=1892856 RepID=UPI0039EB1120
MIAALLRAGLAAIVLAIVVGIAGYISGSAWTIVGATLTLIAGMACFAVGFQRAVAAAPPVGGDDDGEPDQP